MTIYLPRNAFPTISPWFSVFMSVSAPFPLHEGRNGTARVGKERKNSLTIPNISRWNKAIFVCSGEMLICSPKPESGVGSLFYKLL